MSRSNRDDPPTMDYAGKPRTDALDTPPVYFWLFIASFAAQTICVVADISGVPPPSDVLDSAMGAVLRAAVLAMNVVAIWSLILLYRGYWKNTTIGFLAVVSVFLSIAGDIGLVVW